MTTVEPFDSPLSFAVIERLVCKIYFRFSHLVLAQPEIVNSNQDCQEAARLPDISVST